MTDSSDEPTEFQLSNARKGTQQAAERAVKAARVAAALRANLLKRKQQARARAAGDEPSPRQEGEMPAGDSSEA